MISEITYPFSRPVLPDYINLLEIVNPHEEPIVEEKEEYITSDEVNEFVAGLNNAIKQYPQYSGQPLLDELEHVGPDEDLQLLVPLSKTAEEDIISSFHLLTYPSPEVQITGANLHPLLFSQYLMHTCFPKSINVNSIESYPAEVEFVDDEWTGKIFVVTIKNKYFQKLAGEFVGWFSRHN